MELKKEKGGIKMPYLEERIEQLEKEVQELREAKRAEQYKTPVPSFPHYQLIYKNE